MNEPIKRLCLWRKEEVRSEVPGVAVVRSLDDEYDFIRHDFPVVCFKNCSHFQIPASLINFLFCLSSGDDVVESQK